MSRRIMTITGFFTAFLALGWLLQPAPVWAQSNPEDRVRELIDRFDARFGDVQALVEASRNPVANNLLTQAQQLRDQAETQLRNGNLEAASSLATRALETLKQAEDAARSGGPGGGQLEQLRRMVDLLRRRFDDTRRDISDLETRQTEEDAVPGAKLMSIYDRQRERTQSLLEEAEQHCNQVQNDNTSPDVAGSRCDELIAMARRLFDQSASLVPEEALPVRVDPRQIDNQIRDVRRILDQSEADLDAIEREIDSGDPSLAASIARRLRNLVALNQQANNRLSSIFPVAGDSVIGRINTALGIQRRAAELARTALQQGAETDSRMDEEFVDRLQVVQSLENNIQDRIQNADGMCADQFEEARRLLEQAQTLYEQGEVSQAIQVLSQAATLMNRAFACVGADRSDAVRLEVLHELWNRYDREREHLGNVDPTQAMCAQMLTQADSLRAESERLQQSGNLDGAFTTINQAQKQLSQASGCMGMNVPRIQSILDRLQDEFDRRHGYLEDGYDIAANPAASVLFSEAENLRNLSDTQESQGHLEQAVQSVGRAISTLSQVRSLVTNEQDQHDREILQNLLQQFDLRYSTIETMASQLSASQTAGQPLSEAARLRQQAETSANAGRVRQALNEVGQATQLLEQAARAVLQVRQ